MTATLLATLASVLRKTSRTMSAAAAPDDHTAHFESRAVEAAADILSPHADVLTARVYHGAEAAYCAIVAATGPDGERGSYDVRLAPGRSVSQSLRESADDCEAQAFAMLRRAARYRAAADMLANDIIRIPEA